MLTQIQLHSPTGENLTDKELFTLLGLLNRLIYVILTHAGALAKVTDPETKEAHHLIDRAKLSRLLVLARERTLRHVIPDTGLERYLKQHWPQAYSYRRKIREVREIAVYWGLFDREPGTFDPRPGNRSRQSPPYTNINIEKILEYYEAIEEQLVDRGYDLEEDFPEHKGAIVRLLSNAVNPETPYRRREDDLDNVEFLGIDVGCDVEPEIPSVPLDRDRRIQIEANERWFQEEYGYSLWWQWIETQALGVYVPPQLPNDASDWREEHLLDMVDLHHAGKASLEELHDRYDAARSWLIWRDRYFSQTP